MDNYLKDLTKIADDFKKKNHKPGVYPIEILHDDWCNLLNGKGEWEYVENCPEYEEAIVEWIQ